MASQLPAPVQAMYSRITSLSPGTYLREEMIQRGWAVHRTAAALHMSEQKLTLILDGGSITREDAEALSLVFGESVKFWLNLQNNYIADSDKRKSGSKTGR